MDKEKYFTCRSDPSARRFCDMMTKPWLWPPAGEDLSTVVDWETDFGMNYQFQCPAQPGDRLKIVARFAQLDVEVSIKFLVMLEVEYELVN